METEQRRTNRQAAEIMTRTIRPEQADWSAEAARYFLGLRFASQDLDRFHALLANDYADSLSPGEQAELESYRFVNCFAEMLRERARRSLARSEGKE